MDNKPLIIGIAGGSGSGKTTLVKKLMTAFGDDCKLISHDDYYLCNDNLPMEERVKINYDHPNSLDTDLLVCDIKKLLAGESIFHPTYDFTQHNRSPITIEVAPTSIILVEGILIFESTELCDLMDIKIYVDADDDIRFVRRLSRDVNERGRSVDSVIEQYLTTVKPMYEQFIKPNRRKADIIVPQGGHNTVALNLIIDSLKLKLNL